MSLTNAADRATLAICYGNTCLYVFLMLRLRFKGVCYVAQIPLDQAQYKNPVDGNMQNFLRVY